MAASALTFTPSKVYQSFLRSVTAPPMLLPGRRQQQQLLDVLSLRQQLLSLKAQIKTSKTSTQEALLRAQLKALEQTIKRLSTTSYGIASAAKKELNPNYTYQSAKPYWKNGSSAPTHPGNLYTIFRNRGENIRMHTTYFGNANVGSLAVQVYGPISNGICELIHSAFNVQLKIYKDPIKLTAINTLLSRYFRDPTGINIPNKYVNKPKTVGLHKFSVNRAWTKCVAATVKCNPPKMVIPPVFEGIRKLMVSDTVIVEGSSSALPGVSFTENDVDKYCEVLFIKNPDPTKSYPTIIREGTQKYLDIAIHDRNFTDKHKLRNNGTKIAKDSIEKIKLFELILSSPDLLMAISDSYTAAHLYIVNGICDMIDRLKVELNKVLTPADRYFFEEQKKLCETIVFEIHSSVKCETVQGTPLAHTIDVTDKRISALNLSHLIPIFSEIKNNCKINMNTKPQKGAGKINMNTTPQKGRNIYDTPIDDPKLIPTLNDMIDGLVKIDIEHTLYDTVEPLETPAININTSNNTILINAISDMIEHYIEEVYRIITIEDIVKYKAIIEKISKEIKNQLLHSINSRKNQQHTPNLAASANFSKTGSISKKLLKNLLQKHFKGFANHTAKSKSKAAKAAKNPTPIKVPNLGGRRTRRAKRII